MARSWDARAPRDKVTGEAGGRTFLVAVPEAWEQVSKGQTRPVGDSAQRDPDVSIWDGMGWDGTGRDGIVFELARAQSAR